MRHPDLDFFSPDDDDDPAYGWVVVNGDKIEPADALRMAAQLARCATHALNNRANQGDPMTDFPGAMARGEVSVLLEECSGGLVLDERGILVDYTDRQGEHVHFNPSWNQFGHPIHDLPHEQSEECALEALRRITAVMTTLFPPPVPAGDHPICAVCENPAVWDTRYGKWFHRDETFDMNHAALPLAEPPSTAGNVPTSLVVVVGNVSDGFEFYGPYPYAGDADEAGTRATRLVGGTYLVAELHAPEELVV